MSVLWLEENPCCDIPGFFQYLVLQLPRLKCFDKRDITEQDRQEALSGVNPTPNVKRPSSSESKRYNSEREKDMIKKKVEIRK